MLETEQQSHTLNEGRILHKHKEESRVEYNGAICIEDQSKQNQTKIRLI